MSSHVGMHFSLLLSAQKSQTDLALIVSVFTKDVVRYRADNCWGLHALYMANTESRVVLPYRGRTLPIMFRFFCSMCELLALYLSSLPISMVALDQGKQYLTTW